MIGKLGLGLSIAISILNTLSFALVIAAWVEQRNLAEAMGENWSWEWTQTAFICAFGQTGFWLPFRFTEKAYSQGPTGCIWAILTLSLNGLFACGGVSLLATTLGDVSQSYQIMNLCAVIFSGISIILSYIMIIYMLKAVSSMITRGTNQSQSTL